ncbi:cytidine deaminase-like protein [Xylariaceae sp. FL1019]|nr:cytidine deaminase-like protein [Xylariaceae sp. FL1019]
MAPNPSRANLTEQDLRHLRRTIALASESLSQGDAPFGSVLVAWSGDLLAEDRNRIKTLNDGTKHPEIELARWAAANIPFATERKTTTMYTSGEHCPMCSAAHAWVGLGRIVYVASAKQLEAWQREFRENGDNKQEDWKTTVCSLPINSVAPGIEVVGPVPELEREIYELHRAYAAKDTEECQE